MSDGYGILAGIYDSMMDEVDYGEWADALEEIFRRYGDGAVRDVCELGCGTGAVTSLLAKRGYSMIGIDLSPEMLSEAKRRSDCDGDGTLYLMQDMRNFELYGTVDAVISCMDSINHLTGAGDFAACAERAALFLNPNGLFVFDVNSRYKYENIYSGRDYVLEDGHAVCAWRNGYNEKTKLCDFYITVFTEREDGLYERSDSRIRERCYSDASVKRVLKRAGFCTLAAFGGTDLSPVSDESERIWYVARKIG